MLKVPSGASPAPSFDGVMLWAAACTGFFGFLQAAEFTTPSLANYDAGAHLSVADVALDLMENPSVVWLSIKASKTDPFCKGVSIFLAKTGADICPVGVNVARREVADGPYLYSSIVLALCWCNRSVAPCQLRVSTRLHTAAIVSESGLQQPWAKKGVEDCIIQVLKS